MEIRETHIAGLFVLKSTPFKDVRGSFQKLFNLDYFKEKGLNYDFQEFYFSISQKDVIRGMHFQTPPFDHVKLVYVSKGRIKDVVVDLRTESATYGHFFDIELDSEEGEYLYIPKGLAHGFASLKDDAIVNYAQTSCYSKEADCGILYNSFGYEWGIENPIISERDLGFESFEQFNSPF